MSNRTDYSALADELADLFALSPAARERLETELHNAHVAGTEGGWCRCASCAREALAYGMAEQTDPDPSGKISPPPASTGCAASSTPSPWTPASTGRSMDEVGPASPQGQRAVKLTRIQEAQDRGAQGWQDEVPLNRAADHREARGGGEMGGMDHETVRLGAGDPAKGADCRMDYD